MGDKSGEKKLAAFDLDIDGVDFCTTRIYKAIKDRAPSRVLRAIYCGEDVTLRDNEFNSTYLHLVVSVADPITEEKLVPMVYQLSNAGTDVHAKDYKGRTALELAVGRELQDLMVALVRVGVNPTEKDYGRIIQNLGSPFELELLDTLAKYEPGMWESVTQNNTAMIHMLVNSWCRVNTTRDGTSLIDFAKDTNKSPELILVLEDFEVTIEFVHATLAGDERRMLEFLMDSKPCDPSIMDISHQERWSSPILPRSLRDTAKAMGHMHVLHLLPEALTSDSDQGQETESQGQEVECEARDNHNGEVVYQGHEIYRQLSHTASAYGDLELNLNLLEESMDRQSVASGPDRTGSIRGHSRSQSVSTTRSEGAYLEEWYNFHDNKGSRHSDASYVTPRLAQDYSKSWHREKEKAERKYSQKKAKYKPSSKKNKESKMCVIS